MDLVVLAKYMIEGATLFWFYMKWLECDIFTPLAPFLPYNLMSRREKLNDAGIEPGPLYSKRVSWPLSC